MCMSTPIRFLSQRLLTLARKDMELLCDTAAVRDTGNARPLLASLAVFAGELESVPGGVTISDACTARTTKLIS